MRAMTQERSFFKRIGMASFAILVFTAAHGGTVVQAHDADKRSPKSGHASSQAYPDAVLSATDKASGITVAVDPNGTGLTATDKAGQVLWKTDVVRELGAPKVGAAVIRRVTIGSKGVAELVLGKHMAAAANLRTGQLKWLGEN
jgi:hypothetical protein